MGKSIKHISSKKISGKHTSILELIHPLVKEMIDLENVKKVSLGKIKMLSTKIKKITISKLHDSEFAININFTANGVQDIRIFLNNSIHDDLMELINEFSLKNNYVQQTTYKYG